MLNEILNFRLLKREVKIISDFEVHASKFKVKATKNIPQLVQILGFQMLNQILHVSDNITVLEHNRNESHLSK